MKQNYIFQSKFNIKIIFLNFWLGEYAVRILSKNDDIPKSPYMVDIVDKGQTPKVPSKPAGAPSATAAPGVDASLVTIGLIYTFWNKIWNLIILKYPSNMKVYAFGPGLEKEGNLLGKWAEFTVDATKTGKGTFWQTFYWNFFV